MDVLTNAHRERVTLPDALSTTHATHGKLYSSVTFRRHSHAQMQIQHLKLIMPIAFRF